VSVEGKEWVCGMPVREEEMEQEKGGGGGEGVWGGGPGGGWTSNNTYWITRYQLTQGAPGRNCKTSMLSYRALINSAFIKP
jgi:hypothetical protein